MPPSKSKWRFDHLVVLMLENRSFDNLFGYLYESETPRLFIPDADPVFRGVAGRNDLFNVDQSEPPKAYHVAKAPWEDPQAMFAPYPNAGEFYHPNINRQIYGSDDVSGSLDELPRQGLMQGFVQDYIRVIKESKGWDGNVEPEPETVQQVMNCYPPEALPLLSGLARSFAISDAWFSSVPSATWCNRSFVHSGTSRGRVLNKPTLEWVRHHDQPTIFERLADKLGVETAWRVYGEEVGYASLTRLLHRPLRDRRFDNNFQHLDRFYEDCAAGSLPAYSFLEPRMMSNVNDMHPPYWLNPFVASSVLAGEAFVNEVYNAVRQGKRWDRTLLVITFDEHGGLYDHVVPPCNAMPPQSLPGDTADFGFRFDRFGLRVPTLFISPYVAERTVIRAAGETPFDHTSIIKTLCKRWDLEGLTERDSAAPDFLPVLALAADAPRLETPAMTPREYVPMPEPKAHRSPLGHLGHQLAELMAAELGKELPKLELVGDLHRHFFHR
jgi:phospholipase C